MATSTAYLWGADVSARDKKCEYTTLRPIAPERTKTPRGAATLTTRYQLEAGCASYGACPGLIPEEPLGASGPTRGEGCDRERKTG